MRNRISLILASFFVFVSSFCYADSITLDTVNQIVQRDSSGDGNVTLTGSQTGSPAEIEYRIVDYTDGNETVTGHAAWQTLVSSPGATWSGDIVGVPSSEHTTLDDWFKIQLRQSDNTTITDESGKFGVGAIVFVGGQSNAGLLYTRNADDNATAATIGPSFGSGEKKGITYSVDSAFADIIESTGTSGMDGIANYANKYTATEDGPICFVTAAWASSYLDKHAYKETSDEYTASTIAFVDGGGGNDTITDSASGFLDAGIGTGLIEAFGSASNDSIIISLDVTAGVITVPTGSLTTESAGESITIVDTIQYSWLDEKSPTVFPEPLYTLFTQLHTELGGAELVLWYQGEADTNIYNKIQFSPGDIHYSDPPSIKDRYAENLQTLVDKFRTDFAATTPITICELSRYSTLVAGDSAFYQTPDFPRINAYDDIRKAQRDIVDNNSNIEIVSNYQRALRDDSDVYIHLDLDGRKSLGTELGHVHLHQINGTPAYSQVTIINATAISSTETQVELSESGVLPTTSIQGFIIWDDDTRQIPSAATLSGTTVTLTHTSITGKRRVDYMTGNDAPDTGLTAPTSLYKNDGTIDWPIVPQKDIPIGSIVITELAGNDLYLGEDSQRSNENLDDATATYRASGEYKTNKLWDAIDLTTDLATSKKDFCVYPETASVSAFCVKDSDGTVRMNYNSITDIFTIGNVWDGLTSNASMWRTLNETSVSDASTTAFEMISKIDQTSSMSGSSGFTHTALSAAADYVSNYDTEDIIASVFVPSVSDTGGGSGAFTVNGIYGIRSFAVVNNADATVANPLGSGALPGTVAFDAFPLLLFDGTIHNPTGVFIRPVLDLSGGSATITGSEKAIHIADFGASNYSFFSGTGIARVGGTLEVVGQTTLAGVSATSYGAVSGTTGDFTLDLRTEDEIGIKSAGAGYLMLDSTLSYASDRTLNINPDASGYSLSINGSATIDNWFDQNTKTASAPTFANRFFATKTSNQTLTTTFFGTSTLSSFATPTFIDAPFTSFSSGVLTLASSRRYRIEAKFSLQCNDNTAHDWFIGFAKNGGPGQEQGQANISFIANSSGDRRDVVLFLEDDFTATDTLQIDFVLGTNGISTGDTVIGNTIVFSAVAI